MFAGARLSPHNPARHAWRMFFALLALVCNLVVSSVITNSQSRNSASSALYHEYHRIIGAYEREAKIYHRTVEEAQECMEDLQVVCETLRCRRRTPLLRAEELQLEKQQLLEKCNRLERDRISQMESLKLILGSHASPIYDYFEAMERSISKALKRAIHYKDWRRVVGLQASLRILIKDKHLIVRIFVEERTAGTTSNRSEVSFESLYNTSKSISSRRSSQ